MRLLGFMTGIVLAGILSCTKAKSGEAESNSQTARSPRPTRDDADIPGFLVEDVVGIASVLYPPDSLVIDQHSLSVQVRDSFVISSDVTVLQAPREPLAVENSTGRVLDMGDWSESVPKRHRMHVAKSDLSNLNDLIVLLELDDGSRRYLESQHIRENSDGFAMASFAWPRASGFTYSIAERDVAAAPLEGFTAFDVPRNPSGLEVIWQGTSAALTWAASATHAGAEYSVAYREGSTPPQNCGEWYVQRIGTATSVTITDLDPSKSYALRLCAANPEDQSPYSQGVTATLSPAGALRRPLSDAWFDVSGVVALLHLDQLDTDGAVGDALFLPESSGNSSRFEFKDDSGTHNTTTALSQFMDSGLIDNAVVFDGNDLYVQSTGVDNLFPEASGSVVMWAKRVKVSGRDTFMTAGMNSEGSGSNYIIYADNGTSLEFGTFNDPGFLECDVAWEADVWFHIAATWDGSGRRLYVNGALCDEDTYVHINPGYRIALGHSHHCLYHENCTPDDPLEGQMDEFALFAPRVLSAAEIEQIYQEQRP